MVDFDTNSQKALYFQGFSCIIELEQGEKSIRLKAVSLSFFICRPAEVHMPEKKVQRIEKNSLPIWGTKRWAFTLASVPACLLSSTVWLCRFLRWRIRFIVSDETDSTAASLSFEMVFMSTRCARAPRLDQSNWHSKEKGVNPFPCQADPPSPSGRIGAAKAHRRSLPRGAGHGESFRTDRSRRRSRACAGSDSLTRTGYWI